METLKHAKDKKIIFFVIVLFYCNRISAQIQFINSFTSQSINSIFKSGNNYKFGGDGGYIAYLDSNFKYRDSIPSPSGIDTIGRWFQLSHIVPNKYFIFCPSVTQIFNSNDEGLHWDTILNNNTFFGKEFHMFDSLNGTVLCFFGRSLITNDGGKSWKSVGSPLNYPLSSAKYGDDIICSGLQSGFSWSNDRGINWKFSPGTNFPIGAYQLSFHYINPSILMSVSNDPSGPSFYSYSTDSGNNWIHKPFANNMQPSDLYFESVSSGIVVGSQNGLGTILITKDSGSTWEPIIANIQSFLGIIEKTSDSIYLIGGGQGVLIKLTKNLIPAVSDPLFKLKSIKIYPNPCNEIQTIDFLGYSENIFCQLISIEGKLIDGKKLNNKNNFLTFDFSNLLNGIYFYKIQVDNRFYYFRTIK